MNNSLSLLIPAFNEAKFITRLLRSAKAQTVPFDEILVYDDCSTDATAAVAAEHGAKVLRGSTNLGCSHGKNQLAMLTTCGWLHFHDADDELKPTFSARAREWMKKDCADVVLFDYEMRDENGELSGIRTFDRSELEADALSYAIRNQINPFCGLYRRSTFLEAGGYDTDPLVLYNEDVAMHVRVASHGLRFSAEPDALVINHRRTGSMSAANQAKCVVAQWNVLKKTLVTCGPKYHADIAYRLWQVAAVAASLGDWKTADACAICATELGHLPRPGLFQWMCRISPQLALRVREGLIRLGKPHLRGAEN